MAIPFLKSIKARAGARSGDALALFEAETSSSTGEGPVETEPGIALEPPPGSSLDAFAASDPITLETVMAQPTPISWHEAVAIIEGTCSALLSGDGEASAPDPAGILLTAEGAVEVRAHFGFARADSVQRLARTMHDLTAGQSIPAPLRLFISKWVDAEGNRSLATFARELGYFARPNGAEIIRQLYERCVAFYRSPAFVHAPAAKAKAAKTQKKAEPDKPKPQKPPTIASRRQRAALVAAVAASVFALAFGVASYVSPRGQTGSSDLLASLMARAADFARSLGDVRTQLGSLSAQLSAHLGSGADAPGRESPPAPASASASTPNRARATVRASGGTAAARVPSISVLPTVSGVAAGIVMEPPAASDSSSLELEGAKPGAADAAAPVIAVARDPDAVYSNEDPAVAPPRMVYPQLPPPALVLGSSSVNVMEIIIGDDGRVEKVKLVSPPRRMTDMMLLSGAKLWRFSPASLDGFPVRYRLAVSWSASVP